MSASIAVMMTVAAAAVVVQPRGCALTPPPVHLQAAAGIPEAGGGRAEGQGAQPGFLSGTLQPDSGTAGGGARSKLLAPEKPSDRASSPPFPVAPGGGHRSRTLLAARPRPPQGEGGGRASWVFPGSPLPRTSGPEHLPRAFVARPQAGLAPICRRPRPPPHLHAPPPGAVPGALAPAPALQAWFPRAERGKPGCPSARRGGSSSQASPRGGAPCPGMPFRRVRAPNKARGAGPLLPGWARSPRPGLPGQRAAGAPPRLLPFPPGPFANLPAGRRHHLSRPHLTARVPLRAPPPPAPRPVTAGPRCLEMPGSLNARLTCFVCVTDTMFPAPRAGDCGPFAVFVPLSSSLQNKTSQIVLTL